MKRILSFVLITVMMFSMCACSKRNTSDMNDTLEILANVVGEAVSVAADVDVSGNNTSFDSDFVTTITLRNRSGWILKSPFSGEERGTITYNSTNNYICDCAGLNPDPMKLNIRTAMLTEEEEKQAEESGSCFLSQSESEKILKDVTDNFFIYTYKPAEELTDAEKHNFQVASDYLRKLWEGKFSVEDELTNYYIYDVDGNKYQIHSVWDIYDNGTQDDYTKRLQANYIVYNGYKVMLRIAREYEEYYNWFQASDNGVAHILSLQWDYETIDAIHNAESDDEIIDLLKAREYKIVLNDNNIILPPYAAEFVYKLQTDIILGDYVPAE